MSTDIEHWSEIRRALIAKISEPQPAVVRGGLSNWVVENPATSPAPRACRHCRARLGAGEYCPSCGKKQ